MNGYLGGLTVVLARPQDGANVGSACRAMKTMGITRLRIVGPCPDPEQARLVAVHAVDVLERAERVDTVAEAVADCALAAGVTRREGRWRKQLRLSPEEMAEHVAAAGIRGVALVFGNEESGLSDEELEPCSLAVAIPTSPLFPSLNLSHAVQIVSYALFRRLSGAPAGRYAPVGADRVEAVTEAIMASLRDAGCFSRGFEHETRLLYRDILRRAALSQPEAERVERIFDIQRSLIAGLRSRAAGH